MFFPIILHIQIPGNGSMNIKQTEQITYDISFDDQICQITLKETEELLSDKQSIFTIFFYNLFFVSNRFARN